MPIQQQVTGKSNLEQLKMVYTPNLGLSSIYRTPASNTPIEGSLVIPLRIQQEKESNTEKGH